MTIFWIILAIIAGIFVFLLAFWLYMLAPNPDGRQRMEPYAKWDYAHRGFYNGADIPENTLAAYRAATDAGFGIELDVRLTRDKKMVIHHDDSLKRLCGDERLISETDFADLAGVQVGGTAEKLPLFAEALETVAGKTPLIVEIKITNGNSAEICPLVADILDSYKGPYVIESFDPEAVRWFRKNRPDVIRGLLVSPFYQKSAGSFKRWAGVNLLCSNGVTRPDFVAYDIQRRTNRAFTLCRKLFGAQEVSWTVRTPEDCVRIRQEGGIPIFEKFDPRDIKQ